MDPRLDPKKTQAGRIALGFTPKPLKKLIKPGRGKRIRTSGPCLPKAVLYRAELFPDRHLIRPEPKAEQRFKQESGVFQGAIDPLACAVVIRQQEAN